MLPKKPGSSSVFVPPTRSPEAITAQALRQRAEMLARENTRADVDDRGILTPEAARRALYELRVHQIELELQNEELRRAQEELEVSRARYFDLYDLAPVGYFTLSEAGLILEANLTGAKLLGVARGELVQQPLSRYVLREDQDVYYLHRKALWETGAPQSCEMRLLKQSAAPFWARMESMMAQDVEGGAACRAVLSDITESKRAERTLKTANAELEEFAFALTHDLQEPLRMVVNFTQLLALEQRGKLDDDAEQYIAYSVEGALRIEALLKGLLNYLELPEPERDRLPLVDCNDVLSAALLTLQRPIQQSGAIVTFDTLPILPGKEDMLTQLFQNLVANSIKYRSESVPRIHVSAARTAEGWMFAVKDNGIGVDPADSEHIFGMFKRLHGKEIPGTGIGLALCRKVVERLDGRIWVESKPGQGAVFKFTIPAEGLP